MEHLHDQVEMKKPRKAGRSRHNHRRRTLEEVEPPTGTSCLCGSGLPFQGCCASRYHEGPNLQPHELFAQGRYDDALKACRLHLTWYALCHRGHTVPLLKSDSEKGEQILSIDIDALAEIVERLHSCYRQTGKINEFSNVLDRLAGLVDDQRWTDKIALCRAMWWSIDRSDGVKAGECISQVDIDKCNDADVIAAYLNLRNRFLQFDDRNALCEKICRLTDDESIRLQYRCVHAISYLLICEQQKAISLIGEAIDDYSSLSADKTSTYGEHLCAHAMLLLGRLQESDDLISEAATCFQRLLECAGTHRITAYGVAQYQMAVGQCKAFLDDHETAIAKYSESISAYPTPLASIYLAQSLVSSGDPEAGRDLLDDIDRDALSKDNRHDYAMARTMLAVVSRAQDDIDAAKSGLESFDPSEPYFVQQRDRKLIELLKTVPVATPGVLSTIIRSINRYVIINPNVFGVGVNVNNLLEDLDRSKK